MTTLRPFGPKRNFHRIVENLDAAQNAVAGVGGKTDVFGSHSHSPPKDRNLVRRDVGSVDDAKDVAFLHDEKVIAIDCAG